MHGLLLSRLNASAYKLSVPRIVIPDNSNLDDYKVPGQYYTVNIESSKTIINTPYKDSGFKLTVEYISHTSHIMQTLKGVNSKKIYFRTLNEIGWSEWN